jgi:hypothetical protein
VSLWRYGFFMDGHFIVLFIGAEYVGTNESHFSIIYLNVLSIFYDHASIWTDDIVLGCFICCLKLREIHNEYRKNLRTAYCMFKFNPRSLTAKVFVSWSSFFGNVVLWSNWAAHFVTHQYTLVDVCIIRTANQYTNDGFHRGYQLVAACLLYVYWAAKIRRVSSTYKKRLICG